MKTSEPSDQSRDSSKMYIEMKLLDESVTVPQYALPGDAGADLVTTQELVLAPGERKLVPTGVAVAIPEGFGGFIHPRSGLAVRKGLSIVNAPGTIDAGYRGEIQVCLINLDPLESIELSKGERIAQLVIQPVVTANFVPVEELSQTVRQASGFGSTGGFVSES